MKTTILNACNIILKSLQARNDTARVPAKPIQLNFLELLEREGFISGFHFCNKNTNKTQIVVVGLKYYSYKTPVLRSIVRISTPGRRLGWKAKQIKKMQISNRVLIILSTDLGLKTLKECQRYGIGGEPLFKIV